MRYRRWRRKMTPKQLKAQEFWNEMEIVLDVVCVGYAERFRRVHSGAEAKKLLAMACRDIGAAADEETRAESLFEKSFSRKQAPARVRVRPNPKR